MGAPHQAPQAAREPLRFRLRDTEDSEGLDTCQFSGVGYQGVKQRVNLGCYLASRGPAPPATHLRLGSCPEGCVNKLGGPY